MQSLMATVYPAVEQFQDLAVLYEVREETLPESIQDGWLMLEKAISYAEAELADGLWDAS